MRRNTILTHFTSERIMGAHAVMCPRVPGEGYRKLSYSIS